MDTDGEEKHRKRKNKVVLLTGGGEATNLERREDLYESIRSWGTEEGYGIPFPYCKVYDEYQESVEPTSLSAKFAAVFMEVESLLNYCVEQTVILNYIIQENNKVLGDGSKETLKFLV